MRECERRLTALETNVIHIKGTVDKTGSVCGRLDDWIRGDNGKGIKQRVGSLEESRDRQRSNRRWFGGILAAVLVSAVGFGIRYWTSK